jgi:hypothetical protein
VSYLISKGVDLEEKVLLDGSYLPLKNVAKHRNHTEILELLRNAGAVPRKLDTNIKGQNNCTLL